VTEPVSVFPAPSTMRVATPMPQCSARFQCRSRPRGYWQFSSRCRVTLVGCECVVAPVPPRATVSVPAECSHLPNDVIVPYLHLRRCWVAVMLLLSS
jgi:hypothetical protein